VNINDLSSLLLNMDETTLKQLPKHARGTSRILNVTPRCSGNE
jgi:hypothetical protein